MASEIFTPEVLYSLEFPHCEYRVAIHLRNLAGLVFEGE